MHVCVCVCVWYMRVCVCAVLACVSVCLCVCLCAGVSVWSMHEFVQGSVLWCSVCICHMYTRVLEFVAFTTHARTRTHTHTLVLCYLSSVRLEGCIDAWAVQSASCMLTAYAKRMSFS